ncbi:hypothetical protein LTR70_007496 [Exophiala xenobiotica]|nr:hypothetical protein LTR70_007496 [Exophiala xenobiotica]
MRLFLVTLVTLASTAAASENTHGFSLFTRSGLDKRQICTVNEITSTSCQECFGAGSVNCLSNTCYNPGVGDSCCSDGNYCEVGNYCTDAGCCPNGTPLEQCGATVSLSVVPPPASEATSPASSASSTLFIQTESTATTVVSNVTSAPTTPTSASIPVASFTGAASLNIITSGKGLVYAVLMLMGNLF